MLVQGDSNHMTSQTQCTPGYYCSGGSRINCGSAVNYCPNNQMTFAFTVAAGSYTTPLLSVGGSGPTQSGTTSCDPSYYCTGDGYRRSCGHIGVYCPGGEASPRTVGSTYYSSPLGNAESLRYSQTRCEATYYCNGDGHRRNCGAIDLWCPGAEAGPRTVDVSYYTTPEGNAADLRSGQLICPNGWYCPGPGSGVRIACGGAHVICPEGSSAPTTVIDGLYSQPDGSDEDYQWWQDPCPIAQWCRNGVRFPCYTDSPSWCATTGFSHSTEVFMLYDATGGAVDTGGSSKPSLFRNMLLDDFFAVFVTSLTHPVGGTPWSSQFTVADVVQAGTPEQPLILIPSLSGSLTSGGGTVSDADLDHLQIAIQRGSLLVVCGDAGGHAIDFLNRLLRWSLVAASPVSSGTAARRASAPADWSAGSLAAGGGVTVYPVTLESMPGTTERIYGVDGASEWAFVVSVGCGRVLYLGGDMAVNPLPTAWRDVMDAALWHLRPGSACARATPRVDLLWDTTGRHFSAALGSPAAHFEGDLIALGHEVRRVPDPWGAALDEGIAPHDPEASTIIAIPSLTVAEPRLIDVMSVEFQDNLRLRVISGDLLVVLGDTNGHASQVMLDVLDLGYAHADGLTRPDAGDAGQLSPGDAVGTVFESGPATVTGLGGAAEHSFRVDPGNACARSTHKGPPSGDEAWVWAYAYGCGAATGLAHDWSTAGPGRDNWVDMLATALSHVDDFDGDCIPPELECELAVRRDEGHWRVWDGAGGRMADVDAMLDVAALADYAAQRCFYPNNCA